MRVGIGRAGGLSGSVKITIRGNFGRCRRLDRPRLRQRGLRGSLDFRHPRREPGQFASLEFVSQADAGRKEILIGTGLRRLAERTRKVSSDMLSG
jgi:hypothetical protein